MTGREQAPGQPNRLDCYVVVTPGIEAALAGELTRLGASNVNPRHGGVSCSATWPQLWSIHLWSRTATRVLVRVSRFTATTFAGLEARLDMLDWSAMLPANAALDVSVSTTAASALYHSDAIAERATAVIGGAIGLSEDGPRVGVLLRVLDNRFTVSLDATGVSLHRRGWRQEVAKAPLRETLAAAVVEASGWDGKAPLVDPFCGSGTIPIEAVLRARRIAPGRNRSFTFQDWPSFDADRWDRLVRAADADVIDRRPIVIGADRDRGALAAARANAERAGVAEFITWREAPISDLAATIAAGGATGRRGHLVTNPPYGERIDGGDLRDLADRWAAVARAAAAGWQVTAIAPPDSPLLRMRSAIDAFDDKLSTSNGGRPVLVRSGTVRV